MNITGRKNRTPRKLLERIRKKYNKKKGAFVSLEKFCLFTGLKPEHVTQFVISSTSTP